MLRLAVIGLFLVGAAACTAAPGNLKSASSEASADPATQAASPEEQKICRDMGTTGSYGPRHVCHTKAQWDKIDAMS
jgi:hypothetical protein